jgi:uncharacterized delta-60 repeat protein
VVLLLLATTAFAAGPAFGAAGDPDPSFGQGGLLATDFGPAFQSSSFNSVETTPGGGIVMWQRGPGEESGFRGYSPGGALKAEPTTARFEPLRTVAPDGTKIEIEATEGGVPIIHRSLADGQPDPAFGHGGEEPLPYFTNSGEHAAAAERVLQLASGKIVVAGSALFEQQIDARTITRTYEDAVMRLDPDGKPDPTFGKGGVVRTRTDLGIEADLGEVHGVAARAGEALAIAVGGYEGAEGELLGLTAAGAVDTGFGADGIAKVKSGIVEIHADAAGGILVAGTGGAARGVLPGSAFVVSRFDGAGNLDGAYGEAGTATVGFRGGGALHAVLWQPDGSVLLGGVSDAREPGCGSLGLCRETPVLARVGAAGQLDSSFGEGGRVDLPGLTAAYESEAASGGGVRALAAAPDGGAYAVGASGATAFAAALDPGGTPVAGFGDGGVLKADYPSPAQSSITDIAVDSKNRILTLGETDSGLDTSSGFVSRRLPDGAPDPSYAGGAPFAQVGSFAERMVVDPSGRALVMDEGTVTRLTSSGTVDGSFGHGGMVAPRPKPRSVEQLHAIAALPSGKVLVAGALGYSFGPRIVVFRLDADGSPDRSFGNGGKIEPGYGFGLTHSLGVTSLLVEPDGHILVGGYVKHHHGQTKTLGMMVAELLPNGLPDRRFGKRGVIFPPAGAGSKVSDLELEHGKVLVAGTNPNGPRASVVVFRYRGDHLDRRFGKHGVARIAVPGSPLIRDARVSLLVTPRRLVAVSGGLAKPVSALSLDGTPLPGYGRGKGVLPTGAGKGKPVTAPVAALQGTRPILAWSTGRGQGRHPTGWLQRLAAH